MYIKSSPMFKTIIIIFSIIIIFIIQPIVTNDIIIEEDAITSGRVVSSVSDDPSTFNYVNACNLISSPNSNPNIYDNFRRIQSYIEIVEPTDLWIAEAYLRYIVQNCSFIVNNKTIFNKVIQIDTYGNPYLHGFAIDDQSPVHVSALAMRFGAFIGKISNMIFNNHKYNDDIQTVLEIGGGMGAFAVIATDIFQFDSYTIVDISEAINVQKKFISHFPEVSSKMKYIDGKKIYKSMMMDNTKHNHHHKYASYDLCISTYAFSELTLNYREAYFEIFIKNNCKYGFFIDNGECFHQLKTAHLKLGVTEIAKRLSSTGLIETKIMDEMPSSTGNSGNCNNYEFYFWPRKREKYVLDRGLSNHEVDIKRKENNHILDVTFNPSIKKYLRYRCHQQGPKSGGWSDRWKGAVFTYMLSKKLGRTFKMLWDGSLHLKTVFEENDILQDITTTDKNSCYPVKWYDQTPIAPIPSLLKIPNGCIDLYTNIIPDTFKPEYNAAANELWSQLNLKNDIQMTIQSAPENMTCAQIRNGPSKYFPDYPNNYGFHGSDPTAANVYERNVFKWLGKSSLAHLWTDSIEQEERWRKYNPNAFFVNGPITHMAFNSSEKGLKRAVIQWGLIQKCKIIAPHSGYIFGGLFLATSYAQCLQLDGSFKYCR